MAVALREHLPPGCGVARTEGGMFFWVRLPEGFDAPALRLAADESASPSCPAVRSTRTRPTAAPCACPSSPLSPELIHEGVALLGQVLRETMEGAVESTP